MGRIRTVKPEFFTSPSVAELSYRRRVLFIGLWCYVDDQGAGRDVPLLIKAELFPLDADVTAEVIEDDLGELERSGKILRYEVEGQRYLLVTGFAEHQRINRPSKPRWPLPPHGGLSEGSVSVPGAITEGSPPEGKGREQGSGKGGEPVTLTVDEAIRLLAEAKGKRKPVPLSRLTSDFIGTGFDAWKVSELVNRVHRGAAVDQAVLELDGARRPSDLTSPPRRRRDDLDQYRSMAAGYRLKGATEAEFVEDVLGSVNESDHAELWATFRGDAA